MAEHPTLEVLRIRPLRPFLVARVLRAAASTGISATLGWHVFELTDSVLALGILGAVQFLPVIPVGLMGGALADSRDRVALARQGVAGLAVATAALALTALWNAPVVWVFGIAFVLANLDAIERPANAAILPALVPPSLFGGAVTVLATGRNAAWALGPVGAGFGIAVGGVEVVYAVAALLLVASAGLLFLVPPALPERPDGQGPDRRDRADAVSLRAVKEGVSFVFGNRAILGAITLDLFAVIFASVDALLPFFAREILGVGPGGFGVLSGAMAVGTFVMAAGMLLRPPGPRPGRALLVAVAVFGGATLVFAASDIFALSLAALAVGGMADQVSMVARETIIQLSTPDALRGRVSAVNFVFIGASNELGRAESGALAAWIGPVASVWVGGVLCLTALGIVALRMPELAHFRVPRTQPRSDSSEDAPAG